MPERDTDLFQVSVCQIGKHRDINVIVGKTLSVLLKPEFFEPFRYLLHRCRAPSIQEHGTLSNRHGQAVAV